LLAAFFMGGPTVSFMVEGLHRLLARHVHIWHMVPETMFASLALAYVSALLMTHSEASRVRSDHRQPGDEQALERAAV
jgi:hypothetical protein